MPRADHVTEGVGGRDQQRLVAAVRDRLPRVLRADLWTVARRSAAAPCGWLGRLPHGLVGAVRGRSLWHRSMTSEYEQVRYGPAPGRCALLVVLQAAALVARAVPAGAGLVAVDDRAHGRDRAGRRDGRSSATDTALALEHGRGSSLHSRGAVPARAAGPAPGRRRGAGDHRSLTGWPHGVRSPRPQLRPRRGRGRRPRRRRGARRRPARPPRGPHPARRAGELTAEERARRTLLEERSRIARELHDVVAHHMSVISIQAQVAPHLVENPSEELKENLAGIRQNAAGGAHRAAPGARRAALGGRAVRTIAAHAARPAAHPRPARRAGRQHPRRRAGGHHRDHAASRARCRRAWSCRRSGSCRRRSATPCGTRPGRRCGSSSPTGRAACTVRVDQHRARPARPRPRRAPGTGCSACASVPRCWAATLATGPTPDGGYEVTAFLPTRSAASLPRLDPTEETP